MKKRLLIWVALSALFVTLPAQNAQDSIVTKKFAERLQNLSASYFAYSRMWDDLDMPAPRGVKKNADYYKLFVPPTFYLAPVEQAFSFEWEPSDHLGMNACDSLYSVYGAKQDTLPVYEVGDLEKSAKIDRWINRMLLSYYVTNPRDVMGNELYFADSKSLDEIQVKSVTRQEDIKQYMQVEDPLLNTKTEAEMVVFKPNFWKKSAAASIQFSQYSISDNWYQGGESTNSLLSEMKLTANYDDRQRVQFENSLEIKIGFITAPSDTMHTYRTNADLFRLNSKLGVRAIKNLYYTVAAEFKTQFFPNYKTNTNDLVSSFFTPAQIDVSVGMDYKLSGKNYNLSLMGAPFSYTFVYLKNDSIINPSSFNVKPGRTTASLYGSKITANLNWKILPNLSYVSKLDYFTTYKSVIVSWENTFEFKFNRYLSTKIFLHPRFDDGVTLTEENDTYFQFKEMLTFGLSYTW